jgi:hypothetical protein
VIDRLVDEADLKPGESVLDPTAGTGEVAQSIKLKEPGVSIATMEIDPDLRARLSEQGQNVKGADFLKDQGTYDKIILTPPFENDFAHLQHAADRLNPGGRAVALISDQTAQSENFKTWASSVGANVKPVRLPGFPYDGNIVTIEKPKISGSRPQDAGTEAYEPDSNIQQLRDKLDIARVKQTVEESQKGHIKIDIADKSKPYSFIDKDQEQRFNQSMGVQKAPITHRISEVFSSLKNKMTREFEHMPNTGEFAEAGFALRTLAKQKDVSSERAVKDIANITTGLNRKNYELFIRKVILDDLVSTAAENKPLPFGFTKKSVTAEHARLNEYIKQYPEIENAIDRRTKTWDALKADYLQSMKNIGMDVSERLSRENYFRHQVLEYVNLKGLFGTGKKLKTPSNRGFIKQRQGSELDINTNYLEAEHEIMAQMLYDIKVAKTIKRIDDNYNIADQVRKDAKEKNIEFEDAIPKGYTVWQPREGNVFYMADSIPAKLAQELTEGSLAELNIKYEDIRKAIAIGGKRRQMIIKEELANTLDNLYRSRSENPIVTARAKILRGWKVWQLVSPRRYAKYNLRNITGDLDAVVAGNPTSLLKIPEAIKDLYNAYVKKSMNHNMSDFFERGGMGATLQAQEMGSINELKLFKNMLETKRNISDIPKNLWGKYWKTARMSTDFREAILRYASYLDYLEQMKKSENGLPKNFGASRIEEVKALSDKRDRAFMLSNDLLGAYDRISVFGQGMREQIFPFWSWKEANTKRYYRLFANAASNGELAQAIGKRFLGVTAVRAPYRAYRIGKFMIKATALWSLLQVWNHTRYPEEEKSLPEGIRTRPHIILGRDKDGSVQYFSRLGALPDLLEWFGLDAAPEYIDRLSSGESPAVIAKEMAKSPVNVIAGGSLPFAKLALEVASRRALYPDVFSPRTIRDRGLYIARSLGLDNEYKELMKLPRRPYKKSLEGAFIYKIDPLEAAYSETYELKNRFMKKKGKYGEGFWLTQTGQDLYNLKLSMRYDDKDSAKKYMNKYFADGGTIKGISRSLMAMDPLYGMKDSEKIEFLAGLNKDEKRKVVQSYEFFARLFEK